MGRDVEYPLTPELKENLKILHKRICNFTKEYFKKCQRNCKISSGYRPAKYNEQAKGSPNSPHKICMAVDLVDSDKEIKKFIFNNPSILVECDLYMEDAKYTPTWVHLDTRKRTRRIFYI